MTARVGFQAGDAVTWYGPVSRTRHDGYVVATLNPRVTRVETEDRQRLTQVWTKDLSHRETPEGTS